MDNEPQWRAAIGENADRYLRHFQKIRASRWLLGWNWAAFWHSTAWFWYRRMYGWSLANLMAPWLLLYGAAWLEDLYDEPPVPLVSPTFFAYLALVFVAVPLFADALYFRHLAARLPRAKPPSQWNVSGATVMVLVWWVVVPICWYAFVFMPVYTGRKFTSEASRAGGELRKEVTEFHARHGRFPNAGEVTVYPVGVYQFVHSVVWDPGQRAIIIMTNRSLPGSRLALRAVEQGGGLDWKCGPIDIKRKLMPLSCRD